VGYLEIIKLVNVSSLCSPVIFYAILANKDKYLYSARLLFNNRCVHATAALV